MLARDDQSVPRRGWFWGEEGQPALALADDFRRGVFTAGDRAEGTALLSAERLHHLLVSLVVGVVDPLAEVVIPVVVDPVIRCVLRRQGVQALCIRVPLAVLDVVDVDPEEAVASRL